MAAWFVNSVDGSGGLGDGTSWANAYLTLAAALTAKAAGDTFWVGSNHAETQASAMTLTSPGTVGNPCFIYCVDHTKASPGTGDLLTTATISTTGNFGITLAGSFYCFGVTFQCGSGNVAAILLMGNTAGCWQRFDSCQFSLVETGAGFIRLGNVQARVDWINTTVKFAAVGQSISHQNTDWRWSNTPSAIVGSVPTTLIAPVSANSTGVFEGVDLSAAGTGKTLVAAAALQYKLYFKDCALGASVTVAAAPTVSGAEAYVIRSDSAATNYRCEKYAYTGTETTETSIIRTGGATDGTTPQSRKIVTTANSKWVLPFESLPLAIWNDVITPTTRTVTVYGNAASLPNNDDIWIEVEYLGSASSPLGSFVNNTKANNLATGAALTADGSTWAGGTTAFSMSVTFTAQLKGPLTIRVKAAKASSTFYIDPAPVLS